VSDRSWARVLRCDQSNWISPGVGHGRNTIADRGKGKQRAVDEKKGQSDDDDDVIEIIERPDPKKASNYLESLLVSASHLP